MHQLSLIMTQSGFRTFPISNRKSMDWYTQRKSWSVCEDFRIPTGFCRSWPVARHLVSYTTAYDLYNSIQCTSVYNVFIRNLLMCADAEQVPISLWCFDKKLSMAHKKFHFLLFQWLGKVFNFSQRYQGKCTVCGYCTNCDVPEVLNVHMNEIYKKLTTMKWNKFKFEKTF